MNPKDVVRDGYDALSYLYRADNADDDQYAPWLEELATSLPDGGAVLDLGCGCGIPVARWLRQHGYTVTGVDISPVQIERARRLVPDADFRCADIAQIEFPDHALDAIVSFYALIHLPLAEQPALFHAMHRWLKPGGRLIATVGAGPWSGTEQNWLGGPAPMYWSHEGTETYLRWVRDAGFSVLWHRIIPEGDGGHTLLFAHK